MSKKEIDVMHSASSDDDIIKYIRQTTAAAESSSFSIVFSLEASDQDVIVSSQSRERAISLKRTSPK